MPFCWGPSAVRHLWVLCMLQLFLQALQLLALLKAASLSLYLCQQAWAPAQPGLPESYVSDSSFLIKGVFKSIRGYLMSSTEVFLTSHRLISALSIAVVQ